MKKTTSFFTCVIIISLSAVMIIASCKKDDNDNSGSGGISNGNFRLIQWISSYNNIEEEKGIVTYQEDKISQMTYLDFNKKGEWTETNKTEYQYPDPATIIAESYDFNGTDWIKNYKEVYAYANDKMIEYLYYDYDDGNYIAQDREIYEYSGDLLTLYIGYDNDNGNWVQDSKAVFDYMENKIKEELHYFYVDGEWQNGYKHVYTYDNDQLSGWMGFNFNYTLEKWDTTGKYMFEYSNGRILKSEWYDYQQGAWIKESRTNYLYDIHGNIESWDQLYYGNGGSYKLTFSYEAGKGNFQKIVPPSGWDDWLFWRPFPTKSPGKISGKRCSKNIFN